MSTQKSNPQRHLLKSKLVPSDLEPLPTLSEVLLGLTDDDASNLQLPAPIVCIPPHNTLVPVTFVVQSATSPMLALREELWSKVLELPEQHRANTLESLFPPPGPPGDWDPRERMYRTRYMINALQGRQGVPRPLLEKYRLRDHASFWRALETGAIAPYFDTTIDIMPPSLAEPWAYQVRQPRALFDDRFSVGYRGCPSVYEYPLRPSIFRHITQPLKAAPIDRLRLFTCNLLVELLWSQSETLVSPYEAESIIQHYKLLPWTYMVDVSYDIDVAKGFAALRPDELRDSTPALYKVVLFNIDCYELGAAMLEALPFERPRRQKAVSVIGLNRVMQDPMGVVVALTEHPLVRFQEAERTSWDEFGGERFRIGEHQFDSARPNAADLEELTRDLYPTEPPEVCELFSSVISALRRNIDHFGLVRADKRAVVKRLAELEGELEVSS